MGWADNFIKVLEEKGEVTFKPSGNSMQGKISSGDQVIIKKIDNYDYKIGDIVLCKVAGNQYLHLISAIDAPNQRYQISNNKNYINGWIKKSNIYGLCVQVKDKILYT
jgi:hypothetical protein